MEKGESYAIVDINICDKNPETTKQDSIMTLPLKTVIKI
ncbi:putative Septin-4, partial [Danaus plexippus plexippus]